MSITIVISRMSGLPGELPLPRYDSFSEFCTINTIFLKPLKTKFHQLWGRNTSGHHIRGDRSSTVLSLAIQLRTTMKDFHSERDLYGSDLKWSIDTYQAAYKKLPQRICDYNDRFLFHV